MLPFPFLATGLLCYDQIHRISHMSAISWLLESTLSSYCLSHQVRMFHMLCLGLLKDSIWWRLQRVIALIRWRIDYGVQIRGSLFVWLVNFLNSLNKIIFIFGSWFRTMFWILSELMWTSAITALLVAPRQLHSLPLLSIYALRLLDLIFWYNSNID